MGSSVKGYVTNNRANTCLGVLKASLLLLLDTSNLAPRPTVLQISTVPQMTWSMINYGPRVWAGGRRDGGGKSLELSTLTYLRAHRLRKAILMDWLLLPTLFHEEFFKTR